MATETEYQITPLRLKKYLWAIVVGWTLVIIILMAGTALIETSIGPLPIHQRYELTLNIAALAGLWMLGTGGLIYVGARVRIIIDEYAKAAQRLAASEKALRKLSSVVQQTDDVVVITDRDGLIEYVNPSFEKLTGYTAAEALGQTPRVLKSDKQSPEFYEGLWDTILSGRVFRDVMVNRRKDGSLYSEEKTITPLTNIKKEITHFVSTGKDITARIETQQFLARRNRELEVLSKATRIFTTSLDLDSVLTTVLEEVRALLNITGCSIWLVDMQSDELVCRQATDPKRDIVRGWRLPAGQGLVGWAVAHKQRLNVPDALADARHFSGVDQTTGLELRSILTIPLMTPVAVIGALQVVDTMPNRFTEADVTLIESLANTTTTAIETARLYESLEESEEYTRRLIDSSLDIIIASDTDRRIIEFNPAAQTYFGYSYDEIIGQHAGILYADPEQGDDIFNRACKNGRCTAEVLNRRKDGEVFPAVLSASTLSNSQGDLIGVMGIAKDISLQKEAEAEKEHLLAAEYEQRLRAESLSEITLALNAHTNPEAVLDEIINQIHILIPHAPCNIMLLKNGESKLMRCVGAGSDSITRVINSQTYQQSHLPLQDVVLKTREAVLVTDCRTDPDWITFEETAWIRSHIVIPICHHRQVLGLLRLDSDTPHALSEQDIERLKPLANAAAIALRNAQLYQQAIEDAQTKLILLNEVNHRVKNNLSAIIGLLYAEQNRLNLDSDRRYMQIMDDLIQRVQSLAAVHTLLSSQEWTSVSLNILLRQIIHTTRQSYAIKRPVNIVVTLSTIEVTPKQAHNLALIINELTINTFKHGRSSKHPEIEITVSAWENDGQIWVEYRDNGPGYPPRILQKDVDDSHIGFNLINNILTRTLQGSLLLNNDGGAVTLFSFGIEVENDKF